MDSSSTELARVDRARSCINKEEEKVSTGIGREEVGWELVGPQGQEEELETHQESGKRG